MPGKRNDPVYREETQRLTVALADWITRHPGEYSTTELGNVIGRTSASTAQMIRVIIQTRQVPGLRKSSVDGHVPARYSYTPPAPAPAEVVLRPAQEPRQFTAPIDPRLAYQLVGFNKHGQHVVVDSDGKLYTLDEA
jgi:hypothetical protein